MCSEKMSPAGFEPARTNTVDLKSNPLDQLGQSDTFIQFVSVLYTDSRYATKRLEFVSILVDAGIEPATLGS